MFDSMFGWRILIFVEAGCKYVCSISLNSAVIKVLEVSVDKNKEILQIWHLRIITCFDFSKNF